MNKTSETVAECFRALSYALVSGVHTFSACDSCGKSARGGWACVDCASQKLVDALTKVGVRPECAWNQVNTYVRSRREMFAAMETLQDWANEPKRAPAEVPDEARAAMATITAMSDSAERKQVITPVAKFMDMEGVEGNFRGTSADVAGSWSAMLTDSRELVAVGYRVAGKEDPQWEWKRASTKQG